MFLFENSAEDLAIENLIQAVETGTGFSDYKDCAIYQFVKIKSLLLFKSLISKPGFNKNELNKIYEKIFNESFPEEKNFYEVANIENISNRR